ncbi:ABC transporter ATP-binding protein [Leucothrix arctica]|uniref:Sugar ABC transporter ATP-binding protein n=1 Tax=Leucothrix arctica TaxID=1481894 RepID=A0A317C5Q5_9GAMM|nr:sn-glycerol-3-phosphate ABC transporter ATP-binding protein UgpC [Leucothrix arctica]PWQ93966.1 sugar ABC transporter ATP-binding protein [Leucothrix arctica]
MPEIRFDGVSKSYGEIEVLPAFDMKLNDGEFTVLVGPSGCGKSTTLRMLAGLEDLSSGQILFDEKKISHLEPKDRDIAMVFQDYALYPHMNIAQNMSFALKLQKVPKPEIKKKVENVAEILGIHNLLTRKPGELSGGQRQRVAMGRAMVRDSSTFLFDEPLSNLDAKLRAKMRTELAEMRNTLNKNMVYVTHDQVEAMTLGDRIVVMANGLIQQQGSPEELFKSPANKFVAGFIGSPSMNFLDAFIVEESGDLIAKGEGFSLKLNPDMASIINTLSSKDVTLGIRPSCFELSQGNGDGVDEIKLTTVVSEYLGAQSVLVTRCCKQDVLVEVQSASPIPGGQEMTFSVKPEDIMMFDKKSGVRL